MTTADLPPEDDDYQNEDEDDPYEGEGMMQDIEIPLDEVDRAQGRRYRDE